MESQDEVANSIAKSKEKLSNLIASKETFLNMRKYKLTAQEQDSQLRVLHGFIFASSVLALTQPFLFFLIAAN